MICFYKHSVNLNFETTSFKCTHGDMAHFYKRLRINQEWGLVEDGLSTALEKNTCEEKKTIIFTKTSLSYLTLCL